MFYLVKLNDFRRKSDKFQILKTLIKEFDESSLPDSYKEILKETIYLCKERLDYFCSYTTQGAPAINKDYVKAISAVFGTKRDLGNDWYNSNYLAKMIVEFLNQHGFRGFFDRTGLRKGDWIGKKIKDLYANAVVFVQIVEQKSFQQDQLDEKKLNWSYEEFCTYKTFSNLRYLFYRHQTLVRPAGLNKKS